MSTWWLVLCAPLLGALLVGAFLALVCICEETYNSYMEIKKSITRWFA